MLEMSTVDWKSRQSFSPGETKGLNDALNVFLATGKAVVQQTCEAAGRQRGLPVRVAQNVP
jgi:hypothetical protein